MKAIIFDLDGTLLNTIDDIADSMNDVLGRHGLPPYPVEAYKLMVGDGAAILVLRATEGTETAGHLLRQMEEEFVAEYARRQADKTAPYPGIPELLEGLAARRVKMAVYSNKPHASAIGVVSQYFPGIKFDAVIGQRPGYPVKPDPGGALEILEIMSLPREEVLYIGDTATDMRTAAAAGLQAIGALWGFRGKAELEESGATLFAQEPADVLAYFVE